MAQKTLNIDLSRAQLIACILKAHSHSRLSVIPVRFTQEGLKCEYEWSLSDMLYSLREHSSSINIVEFVFTEITQVSLT